MIKTLDELRELINNEASNPDDVLFFTEPAYLSAIIGFDYLSGAVIYDFEKMCESLMQEDPETWPEYNDAADFICYNMSFGTQGLAGTPPIILMRPVECEEEDGVE